jgi:hypothetical protein
MSAAIDYKTHILIGVRANGIMTVLRDWPNLPRQSEVQDEIDAAREPYVAFALCTPTSILPAGGSADSTSKPWSRGPYRRG